MPAQLRDGSWSVSSSTTKRRSSIVTGSTRALAWSGWLIVLLTSAATFYAPAGTVLERLLVP